MRAWPLAPYYPINETGSSFYFGFHGVPMIRQGVDRWVTREPSNPLPAPEVVALYPPYPGFMVVYRAHVLTYASWALDLPNGTQIGQLVFRFGYGPDLVAPLVIGVNTAEWSYDRPEAQSCLAHSKIAAREAFNWVTNQDSGSNYTAHNYYTAIDLVDGSGYPRDLQQIELGINPFASEVATGSPCGTPGKYNVGLSGVTIEGDIIVGTNPKSWGAIKQLYR